MTGSIMLIILVVAMIVFMLFGSRKQKKMMEQRYNMLTELLPGDEVSTTAGLYGTVVKVSDTKIDLMIADGIVTTWDLNSVRGKVEATPSELDEELEAAAAGDAPDSDTDSAHPTSATDWKDAETPEIPDTMEGLEDLDEGKDDRPTGSPSENSDK